MRREDRAFREAEIRLAEHRELLTALGLRRVPDDPDVSRFLCRLNEAVLARHEYHARPRLGSFHLGCSVILLR